MNRKLIRLRDEAWEHREKYELHKDSPDDWLRRKVHHDLDRWLMEHREAAIVIITEALERELKKPAPKVSWWKRKVVRP